MNKITIVAALTALSVVSAFGQGSMTSKKPMMPMAGGSMGNPMMGLTAPEKKTAAAMMTKMTPAEKTAMGHAASLCMTQGKMGKPMMTPTAMMKTMSPTDQRATKSAMRKMTPAQKAVAMKMMANCYKAGMMKKG